MSMQFNLKDGTDGFVEACPACGVSSDEDSDKAKEIIWYVRHS